MKKLVLLALAVLASIPLSAQTPSNAPAGTSAGGVPSAPAPSPGDADWAAFKADFDTLKTVDPSDDKVAQPLVTKLVNEAQAFATKYPSDPRALSAWMTWAQLGQLMTQKNWTGGPSAADVDKKFDAMATDPKIPTQVRAEIRIMQLVHEMRGAAQAQDAAAAGSAWDDVEAKFADFQKTFGADFSIDGQTPILVKLRAEELSVLSESPDTARYQALLAKLAQDSQPQIKQLAQQQLDRQKQLADLKTKPLDLKFTAVDGSEVDLAKLRGKVVLIDFWATWCGPCRGEVPNVVAAYNKYHAQGFDIVGISLDQDKDALLSYTKQNGMVWPQYFDGQGWSNAISSKFGIDSIPAMWLIGKDGKLVTTDGREDLAGQVAKLLQAP